MSTNSLKLRCSECLLELAAPSDLFIHLKNVHGMCRYDDFKCSLCLADIDEFGSFKIHTNNCFSKKSKEAEQTKINEEFDATEQMNNTTEKINEAFDLYHDLRMEYSDEVSDFNEHVQKLALNLVLHLSANMSIPRSFVFETLAVFQAFFSETYITGTLFTGLNFFYCEFL